MTHMGANANNENADEGEINRGRSDLASRRGRARGRTRARARNARRVCFRRAASPASSGLCCADEDTHAQTDRHGEQLHRAASSWPGGRCAARRAHRRTGKRTYAHHRATERKFWARRAAASLRGSRCSLPRSMLRTFAGFALVSQQESLPWRCCATASEFLRAARGGNESAFAFSSALSGRSGFGLRSLAPLDGRTNSRMPRKRTHRRDGHSPFARPCRRRRAACNVQVHKPTANAATTITTTTHWRRQRQSPLPLSLALTLTRSIYYSIQYI